MAYEILFVSRQLQNFEVTLWPKPVAYPGIFFRRGGQQIRLRTEMLLGGGSPLVRGSGCSCILVQ